MPPTHPDQRTRKPETRLQQCQRELRGAYANLEAYKKELESSNHQLRLLEAAIKEKDIQILRLGEDLIVQAQKNVRLTKSLDAATKVRPMIGVDELIRQLRTSLESLNEESKQNPRQSKTQLLVDQFEVEIKAGIDLKQGLRLTQLQGEEISPQSVSSVRFALRQAPVITIVDDSTSNK